MRSSSRIWLAALLVIFAALVGWLTLREHEPAHAGRTLSSWLMELGNASFEAGGFAWDDWGVNQAQPNTKAAEAIRQIGTNGIPFLIQALTNRDSAWRVKLQAALPRQVQRWFSMHPAALRRSAAVLAFDALGTQAESATPALTEALYDYQSCKAAAAALSALGANGRTVLTKTISSTNEWAAMFSVWALAHRGVTVSGTLDALESATTNQTRTVSAMACWALGKIGQDKERVIPFLISALNSPKPDVPWGAMYGLAQFGTNATSAIPALTQALQDPEKMLRDAAANALKQIDPEGADKGGVR